MHSVDISEKWPGLLRSVLEKSPIVHQVAIDVAPTALEIDGAADFVIAGKPHRLVVGCKASGQPRYVQMAVSQLGREIFRAHDLCRALVVAPFISPASRDILTEFGMGWLDLAGNVRILFPDLHLEVNAADRDPFATKREQRSLFYPKTARLLKLLLNSPQKSWKITELASSAKVSVGQVSNVRKALLEREWAQLDSGEGFKLARPDALLDEWRDSGRQMPEVALQGYTLLHGQTLQDALEASFNEVADGRGRLLLASHSVARRAAPFLRVAGEFLYADDAGLDILKDRLQLQPPGKGANVTIYAAKDDGIWMDTMALGPVLQGTGLVQTYLDLLSGGERSREAAEHWRTEMMANAAEKP